MTERYRPSNGTEGDFFMADFCDRCERDRTFRERQEDGCEILARTLIFGVNEPDYPDEWTFDENNVPTCTAFVLEDSPPTDYELEARGQLNLLGASERAPEGTPE